MSRRIHITASDITPSRCTVTGIYRSESDAQAALESEDEATCGAFELAEDSVEPTIGARIHHAKGVCWVAA